MNDFQNNDDLLLRNYYESEGFEHERLYDFTNPWSVYFDQSRSNCVVELLSHTEGSLLDIGCGSGFYLEILSREEREYWGALDLSHRKLNFARSNINCSSVIFVQGHATDLPFRDNSFDWILCSEVIEHLLDPHAALREINRVCRNGALITTPTNTSLYRMFKKRLGIRVKYGGTHIREFSQNELLQACEKAGFSVRTFVATPLIEFPGIYWMLRSHFIARTLYRLNKFLFTFIKRFGVFTCVLLVKQKKSQAIL